jgi:putative peptidoglycan lipid II flippase
MLPSIAKFYSQKKFFEFNETISKILNETLFLVIPATTFLILFSTEIVSILFGSSKFGKLEINSTANILNLLAVLIPFLITLLLISKIFYSMRRTKEVMYTNIFAISLLTILYFVFSKINFQFFSEINLVKNFNKLFFLILIFVVSYILATLFQF